MRYKFNDFLIKLLYRKLRFPKSLVYNFLIRINKYTSFQHPSHSNTSPEKINQLGYSLFKITDNKSLAGVINACNEIFQRKKSKFNQNYFQNNPNKDFLLTVESNETLLSVPEIKEFISSSFVANNVMSMLHAPYLINSARLWWTPANETEISSQLYHIDEEDLMQVKLFINITRVSKSSGPFTFIPSEASAKVIGHYRNGKRRFSDKEVYKYLNKKNSLQLIGDSGSGAFIDTSKCLHYGSRKNDADRLVFMVQFLRTTAPLASNSITI